jgi:hypothetical protein
VMLCAVAFLVLTAAAILSTAHHEQLCKLA